MDAMDIFMVKVKDSESQSVMSVSIIFLCDNRVCCRERLDEVDVDVSILMSRILMDWTDALKLKFFLCMTSIRPPASLFFRIFFPKQQRRCRSLTARHLSEEEK